MIMLILSGVNELIRSLLYEQLSILIIILLSSAFFLIKFVANSKRNHEIALTIFWMICYLFIIIGHYYGNSGYFKHSEDSFSIGVASGLIEGLIVARNPNIYFRVIFSVHAVLVRNLVIPVQDKSLIGV